MRFLKQSTAVSVRLGPFVDQTDGYTLETALTTAYTSVMISKNNGTFAAKAETSALSGGAVTGDYICSLNTADTATCGPLVILVKDAAARVVRETFMVVSAEFYNTMMGTDSFTVDLNAGQSISYCSSVSIVSSVTTVSSVGAGSIQDASFASDVSTLGNKIALAATNALNAMSLGSVSSAVAENAQNVIDIWDGLVAVKSKIDAVFGVGATIHQHIVTVGGIPAEGVTCAAFDDLSMNIAHGAPQVSRADGSVFFAGAPGQTLYIFHELAGYQFNPNPQEVTI